MKTVTKPTQAGVHTGGSRATAADQPQSLRVIGERWPAELLIADSGRLIAAAAVLVAARRSSGYGRSLFSSRDRRRPGLAELCRPIGRCVTGSAAWVKGEFGVGVIAAIRAVLFSFGCPFRLKRLAAMPRPQIGHAALPVTAARSLLAEEDHPAPAGHLAGKTLGRRSCRGMREEIQWPG
jgi:hypothetical protein